MPKSKDLEEVFVEALRKQKIGHSGKIFSMGDVNILADYMFGDRIVVFMDNVVESMVHKLTDFKHKYSHYEVILVTRCPKDFLEHKWFTEIYDGKSLKVLIEKLKRQ